MPVESLPKREVAAEDRLLELRAALERLDVVAPVVAHAETTPALKLSAACAVVGTSV
jgi:hypothetical protein